MKDLMLSDLGEFRLLQEIVFHEIKRRFPDGQQGHDCSFFNVPDDQINVCVTTDVGPKPFASVLQGKDDYYSWGWHTVICNVSDLIAAGATPRVFSNSIDARDDMLIEDLSLFIRGMVDACWKYGMQMGGGNMRSGARFGCHGFAIGTYNRYKHREINAHDGDMLYVVGDAGHYIATHLKAQKIGLENISEQERDRLFKPEPCCHEIIEMMDRGFIRTASDNSDGLLGSIWNIYKRSNCRAVLDLSGIQVSRYVENIAHDNGYDPLNLFFFWGDWNLAVAVPKEYNEAFLAEAAIKRIPVTKLGFIGAGTPGVLAVSDGREVAVNIIRNENFVSSGFNANVKEHVDSMLRSRII